MQKIELSLKKTIAASAVFAASAGVALAACGDLQPFIIMEWVGQEAASLNLDVTKMGATLSAMNQLEAETISSIMKVFSKQGTASTEKTGATIIAATSGYANFLQNQKLMEAADKMTMNSISLGFDPCGQAQYASGQYNAIQQAKLSVQNNFKGVQSLKFGDPASAFAAQTKTHNDLFCTADEASLGLCTLSNMPGADTNGEILFSQDTSANSQLAKKMYIQRVAGLPDALPNQSPSNPSAAATLLEAKKRQVAAGFAVNSMLNIQQENETVLPAIKARSEAYFGSTPRAQEWSKNLTSQDESGILRDLLRMQGIQLQYAGLRLKQAQRNEANLAILVEAANQNINGGEAQRNAAALTTKNAQSKVVN
jgi:hypothetical protein